MTGISLVYAPFCSAFMPPLGLPLLAAFLQRRNVPVSLFDLNVELFDRFLKPRYIHQSLDEVQRRYERLKAHHHLDAQQSLNLLDLMPAVLARSQIEQQLPTALQIYHRQKAPLNRQELHYASNIVQHALLATSSALEHLGPHPQYPRMDVHPADFAMMWELPTWREHVEWYRERLLDAAEGVRVVGFSLCYPAQLVMTLLGASILRRHRPEVKIIAGGPLFMLCLQHRLYKLNHDFLAHHAHLFDAGIAQDGEEPLLEYLDAVEWTYPDSVDSPVTPPSLMRRSWPHTPLG